MDNISIIIRNRNEAEFIGFAIQSCLDFFSKPEIIVMNNESNDDSMEVVQYFNGVDSAFVFVFLHSVV